ncbi:hypothetical protein [Lacrimispora sp.]|uniref:major capsid protein n=1 Tax=Lacrimispora sp. TaxID=2719234 RepID=UPI003991BF14
MPFNVLDAISVDERLNFAQNFAVARPTVLDTIFPDIKTQHFKAEYYRLMQGQNLPTPAFVHALDTEAHIGTRPTFEKVLTEKLFIKEKINQSEQLQMYITNGVPDDDGLIKWVFDDMGRLAESVVTRTKIAKGQLMSQGIMKIKENNLDMAIDFGIPSEQKITFGDWSDPEYDIFSDIQRAVKILKDQGKIANRMLTSDTQVQRMRKNKSMQIAIYGAINVGKLVTMAELQRMLQEEFKLQVISCDEMFAYIKSNGLKANKRYFDENKVTIYTADISGSAGIGLWGPTPEEAEYTAFQEALEKMFVTVTMWSTQDPVAKWTKASGMFIPVLPDPYGIVIATVGTGSGTLGVLNVNSVAGTATGDTKVTVSPAKASGNSYKYKVGASANAVTYGQNVQTWSAWDGSTDITAATGQVITIVECDSSYKAVKAGHATVTAKA